METMTQIQNYVFGSSMTALKKWEDLRFFTQEVVYNSMKVNGIKASRSKIFSDKIWQALWLDPTNELIALKPYPNMHKRYFVDENHILPSDEEVALMQTNECFLVYYWPSFKKIGMVNMDMWHLSCPDSMPIVNVRMWTSIWYKQKFAIQQEKKQETC